MPCSRQLAGTVAVVERPAPDGVGVQVTHGQVGAVVRTHAQPGGLLHRCGRAHEHRGRGAGDLPQRWQRSPHDLSGIARAVDGVGEAEQETQLGRGVHVTAFRCVSSACVSPEMRSGSAVLGLYVCGLWGARQRED